MICDVTESVVIINIGNHFKYLFDICELAFVLGFNVLNSDIWNPYVTIVYQLIPFTFFQILICQQPVVPLFLKVNGDFPKVLHLIDVENISYVEGG